MPRLLPGPGCANHLIQCRRHFSARDATGVLPQAKLRPVRQMASRILQVACGILGVNGHF